MKPRTSLELANEAMKPLGYEVTDSDLSANPKEFTVWDGSPFSDDPKIVGVLKFDFVLGEWSGSKEYLVERVKTYASRTTSFGQDFVQKL
jgi:hypothetical protein